MRHILSLSYEQLSALDDAIAFVDMARDTDGGGVDLRPYEELRAKVHTLYDRATAKEEGAA